MAIIEKFIVDRFVERIVAIVPRLEVGTRWKHNAYALPAESQPLPSSNRHFSVMWMPDLEREEWSGHGVGDQRLRGVVAVTAVYRIPKGNPEEGTLLMQADKGDLVWQLEHNQTAWVPAVADDGNIEAFQYIETASSVVEDEQDAGLIASHRFLVIYRLRRA